MGLPICTVVQLLFASVTFNLDAILPIFLLLRWFYRLLNVARGAFTHYLWSDVNAHAYISLFQQLAGLNLTSINYDAICFPFPRTARITTTKPVLSLRDKFQYINPQTRSAPGPTLGCVSTGHILMLFLLPRTTIFVNSERYGVYQTQSNSLKSTKLLSVRGFQTWDNKQTMKGKGSTRIPRAFINSHTMLTQQNPLLSSRAQRIWRDKTTSTS